MPVNIYLRCRHHHAHVIDSDIEHVGFLLQLVLGFYPARVSTKHAAQGLLRLTPVAEVAQGIFVCNHLVVHATQA